MNRGALKVMREGLIWPLVGLLLSAGLVAVVCLLFAHSMNAVSRKSVGLEMSWERGDGHYGPNFIHLESSCLGNPQSGCFCSLDFKTTTSKEFADYVESFGTKRVPVKFAVDYDRRHRVVGASLEGVGEWPGERFQANEKLLGTGFRSLPNQPASIHLMNPADCFPTSAK